MSQFSNHDDIVVSGMGVITSIGQGKGPCITALLDGQHAFDFLQRPGRQIGESQFIGAEIASFNLPEKVNAQSTRTMSLTAKLALTTIDEAWQDAGLDDVDPSRIGLIVGGSNLQLRHLLLEQEARRKSPHFLRPTYGMAFMDTDICGVCTEFFPIRGWASTTGGASASGQIAIIQAMQNIQAGLVDVCVVVGALMDLSAWECHGFRSLGAMGSDHFASDPALACRPFDTASDGFIFGESCGAIVIEKRNDAKHYYASINGFGVAIDRNRNPDANSEGQQQAIAQALQMKALSAKDIDYVNPHGSGSASGDHTELKSLRACGLTSAWINTTKSLIGHGLASAGLVEVVATILQMQKGELHPTRNIKSPISNIFRLVGNKAIEARIQRALTLSYGFGGINSALCIEATH